jgi:hypothetical protein
MHQVRPLELLFLEFCESEILYRIVGEGESELFDCDKYIVDFYIFFMYLMAVFMMMYGF